MGIKWIEDELARFACPQTAEQAASYVKAAKQNFDALVQTALANRVISESVIPSLEETFKQSMESMLTEFVDSPSSPPEPLESPATAKNGANEADKELEAKSQESSLEKDNTEKAVKGSGGTDDKPEE